MFRRFAFLAAAVVLGVTLSASFAEVTFVMKNGQRISGTFSYNHTDHYQLIINGQEKSWPSDEIAMIAFAPGDPSAAEINRLPDVNDPPELERHTIVLRNGQMIRGKIWDFQGDRIIMDMGPGDRRTFTMGETARLYISAPGSRNVYRNVMTSPTVPTKAKPAPDTSGTAVRVEANRAWTDTGINVNKGDRVSFVVSDQIQIGPNVTAGADGNSDLAFRKTYPVPSSRAGMLIGRIGASATNRISATTTAFAIGSRRDPVVMPAAGRLMLGINDDKFTDNSGAFSVKIVK